jgi:thiamine-monophosphate kinase
MRELDLLSRIYDRSKDLSAAYPHVVVGPGDDCAVIATPGQILLKVDQLIEGRHFIRGTTLDAIARKAIARAVSDIAAMAGTPTAALAAAALPRNLPQEPANALFDATARWARHFGCPLVGGDIASFAGADAPLTLTITIVGTPHPRRGPVLRSTARPGDALYVTGAIGNSFDRATGGGRHLSFEPRLREAAWLADTLDGNLHAMMDISDGLGIDAGRMAGASNLSIELIAAAIPLTSTAPRPDQSPPPPASDTYAALFDAIAAGEDYELLFAVPAACPVPATCPQTSTPLTRIGLCHAGPPACTLRLPDGSTTDVSTRGWEHR